MKPFVCRLKRNPEQLGIAINENLFAGVTEDGKPQLSAQISVLWFDVRSPSPCYHNPMELEWMNMYNDDDFEEDDSEEVVEEPTPTEPQA